MKTTQNYVKSYKTICHLTYNSTKLDQIVNKQGGFPLNGNPVKFIIFRVVTMSGKSAKSGKIRKNKKYDKSPEKSGENGGFRIKVMKSQEIWYKNAVNKKVYHH